MENETVLTIDGVQFTEHELKMIALAKAYNEDPFGGPGHMSFVTIAKLAKLVEQKVEFKSDFWSSI